MLFENGWENVPTWECLYVHKKKVRIFLLVHVDDTKNVWKTAEHGMHAKGCQNGSPGNSVWNGLIQNVNDQERTEEKRSDTRKYSSEQITDLSCDTKGHAERCVERHFSGKEKCIMSSVGDNALHRRSLDTTGRLCNNQGAPSSMCSNSKKLYWTRI